MTIDTKPLVEELRRIAAEAPDIDDGHGNAVRPYWTYRAIDAADVIDRLTRLIETRACKNSHNCGVDDEP